MVQASGASTVIQSVQQLIAALGGLGGFGAFITAMVVLRRGKPKPPKDLP